ncbi:MAG: 4-alpha-glucanotransferase [Bacteroidales bacterium]|nr:4-alpha-glucanotransferase [Candidatus Cryptobacteroides caccocaballi]
MKFTIEYFTRWGENLVLRSGGKGWPMSYVPDGKWSVDIDEDELFEDGAKCAEYFYEVVCDGLSTRHEWRIHSVGRGRTEIVDRWTDVPGWKGAGTAIPVFSLRSSSDFGVGEFYDLKLMIDWAAMTGQCFLQLLPINDTTMTGTIDDSYPYNANSTFALHPQFINLPAAGVVVDEEYKALRNELNSFVKDGRPETDYVRVNREKRRLLRIAYNAGKASLTRTKEYRNFVRANSKWLLPYAAFCTLRDLNGTPDFSQWGEFAVYDEKKVEAFCASHKDEVGFNCFLQFHLDRQLREVRNYAHSKGVSLKGDLPIGISRTSVDAWQFPRLFNMDSQAGAPPDDFSADGQNWGFPTYNWAEMAKDGYTWWKARLRKMSEYFDATRIDHILGFFRIWEIPMPVKSGLEGHFSPALPYSKDELCAWGYGDRLHRFVEDPHRPGWYHPRIDATDLGGLHTDFFYHRHNEFWKNNATGKLSSLLGSTNMLACGEDLGMIPACVPDVMNRLNILSLEIQRMSKDPSQTFGNPACYPHNCVCTTSTHDMAPVRAWWEEDRAMTQRFYNEMLGCQGEAPYFCEPWVCRRILQQHLQSPAMLVIFPLQDWLSMDSELRYNKDSARGWNGNPADERINVPAIPRYHWDYRMHLSIEDLIAATGFNAEVAGMIKDSGR